jgi:hypothetical protein
MQWGQQCIVSDLTDLTDAFYSLYLGTGLDQQYRERVPTLTK